MSSSSFKNPIENVGKKKGDAEGLVFIFSEREYDISLKLRAIRSSEFFGARRKAVLRSKGNAWAQVLKSFVKIREVGVLSYLSFTLCLSVFMMLELIEAVGGRLIGPKAWNRIDRKF